MKILQSSLIALSWLIEATSKSDYSVRFANVVSLKCSSSIKSKVADPIISQHLNVQKTSILQCPREEQLSKTHMTISHPCRFEKFQGLF